MDTYQTKAETILAFMKSFEEKVISTENAMDNLRFSEKSRNLAKTHEWLYHCTKVPALESIIKNRELWLSNLKNVNDEEEAKNIDVSEYKDKFYVGCFTYDSNISDDHWEEYGSVSDGVLIGMKKEWFIKKATFICDRGLKCTDSFTYISDNYNEALELKINEQQKRKFINPFYIETFGFYQIIYRNEPAEKIQGAASMNIDGTKMPISTYTPEVVGIVKPKSGFSKRSQKMRNWENEKEVRLKVGIRQMDIFNNGYEIHDEMIIKGAFPKIAIPISADAFKVVKIGFSPKFQGKDAFIEKIQNLLPESEIEVL